MDQNDLKLKEKNLFDRWDQKHKLDDDLAAVDAAGNKGFSYDGAGNEYAIQHQKILFINKQTNSDGNDSIDIRDIMNTKKNDEYTNLGKAGFLFWKTVSAYASILFSVENEVTKSTEEILERAMEVGQKDWSFQLRKCSMINFCKFPGKRVSDVKFLSSYAERYYELISEQIYLYQPNIIVFGGTWNLLENLFIKTSLNTSGDCHSLFSARLRAYQKSTEFCAIEAYHPAAWTAKDVKDLRCARLASLCNLLPEINSCLNRILKNE